VSGSADDDTRDDRPSRPSLRHLQTMPDFGPRYRVIGPIGKGGMGEVFRAYDTELKVEVALKIVRSIDADADALLARFRREIALARKVTSPYVLRVYDLAEYEGLRFLSMEFVDGEDLAALMRRDKQLPLDRALKIVRQVCAGLEAAHAQGVVHRDLKPQNVLVAKDGNVRVADFGLARSIGESGMTASGAVLGSPAYMSPEQVKGDATDERSDIYSLGVMLYQLVAGQAPFRADTPHAVMEMRLHKPPRPLREAAPDAPAHVEAIVTRCLEIDPAKRYATMRELLADLEGERVPMRAAVTRSRPRWLVPALGGGIAAVAVAIALVAWPRGHEPAHGPDYVAAPSTSGSASTPVASAATTGLTPVLVLRFENRTTEPLFDDAVEFVLHMALRYSKHLDPLSGPDLRALAAQLGPDTPLDDALGKKLADTRKQRVVIVHGTIAPKGSSFTIAITARDATSGDRLFTQTADVARADDAVPAIGRLAVALRGALGDKAEDSDHTGVSRTLEADREVTLGRAMQRANDDEGALAHLERAVALDPSFSYAHVALGISYSNTLRLVDANRQYALALKTMDQLNERDRLKFLGDYYRDVNEEYDRSIESYKQLLAIWPNDMAAEGNLAIAYEGRGDIDQALEAGRKAAADHPGYVVVRANVPTYEVLAGEFDAAIADCRRIMAEFSRPSPSVYQYLGLAHLYLGRRTDTLAAYDLLDKVDASGAATARADLALAEGRLGDAAAILDKGLAADIAAQSEDAAEVKLAMLAELKLRRGDKAGARAAAAKVTKEPLRVLQASLVQLAVGDTKPALATAASMATEVAPSRRAMGKLIEGESFRIAGKPAQAMIAIQDALHIQDSLVGHFLLARAALDAKKYAEAYSELRTCIAKRGQMAATPDDVPTYRYVPPFTYYLAQAQDGLGNADAKASYQAFLAMMHDPDPADPLVADARKHVQ